MLRSFTHPLRPDDYLELINPLWSTRELRGRIERIERHTATAATVVIKPGWEWPGHRPGQYTRLGVEVDGRDAARAVKLKLLVPLGEDRFEVPSPALLDAAEQVMAMGISLHAALGVVERVSSDCDSISRAFTKLFLGELWRPFEREGQPEERWDQLIESVEGLRPLASEALLALFKQSMTTQLEGAFGKVIEHQAKRK